MVRSTRVRRSGLDTKMLDALQRAVDGLTSAGLEVSDRAPFEDALKAVQPILGFDGATLYLFDPEREALVHAADHRGRVELVDFLSIGDGSGLSGWTAHDRRPLLISDRTAPHSATPESEYRTFFSLPLGCEHELLGVVNMGWLDANSVDTTRRQLAQLCGSLLGLLVARQRLVLQANGLRDKLVHLETKLEASRRGERLVQDMACAGRTVQEIINRINNPLEVILGNVQCLIAQKDIPNQRALRRLRKVEKAAMDIAEENRRLLRIGSLTDQETAKTAGAPR